MSVLSPENSERNDDASFVSIHDIDVLFSIRVYQVHERVEFAVIIREIEHCKEGFSAYFS
jgi:hypothetical protein